MDKQGIVVNKFFTAEKAF